MRPHSDGVVRKGAQRVVVSISIHQVFDIGDTYVDRR